VLDSKHKKVSVSVRELFDSAPTTPTKRRRPRISAKRLLVLTDLLQQIQALTLEIAAELSDECGGLDDE
jgi:hypothetical protein